MPSGRLQWKDSVSMWLAASMLALLSCATCQLDKPGYCRAPEAALRALPGNFSRPVDADLDSTTDAAGSPLPATAELANCTALSFSDEFDQLLGEDWSLNQIGPTFTRDYAHEGPVYLPESDDVFFLSQAPPPDTSTAEAWLLNLGNGTATQVKFVQPLAALNSATTYGDRLAVCIVGSAATGFPAGIALLDPYSGESSLLVNNWQGLRFYGVNDIVALADGSLIFTTFNSTQPTQQQTSLGTWILPPEGGGQARILIDDLPASPNGLALSPDHKVLYVSTFTTTESIESGDIASQITGNKIYAFDLVNSNGGIFAENQRLFAAIDMGFADGIKADASGNIYASAGDGVQIFSPAGRLLGKILLPNSWTQQPTQNLVFAGSKLVILHHTDVLILTTNTTGADVDIASS